MMSTSIFANVPKGPAIEVFALTRSFIEDTNTKKVNLSVGGMYRMSRVHKSNL